MKHDIKFCIGLLFAILAKHQKPHSWYEIFANMLGAAYGALAVIGWIFQPGGTDE